MRTGGRGVPGSRAFRLQGLVCQVLDLGFRVMV